MIDTKFKVKLIGVRCLSNLVEKRKSIINQSCALPGEVFERLFLEEDSNNAFIKLF